MISDFEDPPTGGDEIPFNGIGLLISDFGLLISDLSKNIAIRNPQFMVPGVNTFYL